MRPWLSLTTFFCPTKTATEPEICSFKKYYYLQFCNFGRVILVLRTHSRRIIFFPLDDWVVKDRGGECFSTLTKQFAIFSPYILHRRLLSSGNNTGETRWKYPSWHSLPLKLCVINWELDVSEFQCFPFSAHSIYWNFPSVCSGAHFSMVLVTFQARSQMFKSKSKE